MSLQAPVFNFANFAAQFPAFASLSSAQVQFAWDMGANWINQSATAGCWGLGSSVPSRWQQAADLMCAVILAQLYAPSAINGAVSGAVSAASEGSVSAQIQLPEIGSSAFRAMLLAYPPYGPLLLSLLQISASAGPYIPSGRPAWVPP